jgi:hypothetical protein
VARTLRLGEDGEAKRPDVEKAEPDGGEAERADQHQPPSQRRHALLRLRHAPRRESSRTPALCLRGLQRKTKAGLVHSHSCLDGPACSVVR